MSIEMLFCVFKCIEAGITDEHSNMYGHGLGDRAYNIGEEVICGTAKFRVDRKYRENELNYAKNLELPKALSTFDFGKYEFINFKEGDSYYNIDEDKVYTFNGNNWIPSFNLDIISVSPDEIMEIEP